MKLEPFTDYSCEVTPKYKNKPIDNAKNVTKFRTRYDSKLLYIYVYY